MPTTVEPGGRYAINTAQQHDAEVVTLHVIEPLPQNARVWIDLHVSEKDKQKFAEINIQQSLEKLRKRWNVIREKELADDPDAAGREDEIIVEEGYPAEVILQRR